MTAILVTGAEGFVGRHLLKVFGHAFPEGRITGVGLTAAARLDVTDRAAVFAAIAALQPDVCVHLAGIAAVDIAGRDPAATWAVNLHGAINIAEAILQHAPACRLIFISSSEIYGASFGTGTPLDEAAPPCPLNLYAVSKASAELALGALAARGLRLLRLRPFNHTGPGQSEAFVVPAFAAQIARIEAGHSPPVILVGALTPERDFLDVADICAAYAASITRFDSLPNNTVLNIASGRAVAISEILATLLSNATRPIEIREDPIRLRPVEILRATGNASAARRLLGWAPQIPLSQTLQNVLASARAQLEPDDFR